MSFASKVFVITGANSGMGYDTAKYLADEGAKVTSLAEMPKP